MQATAVPTTDPSTLTPTQIAALAAFDRAVKAKLYAYKVTEGVYEVPSSRNHHVLYTVSAYGPGWHQFRCNCEAGHRGMFCLHCATASHARDKGYHAARPSAAVVQAEAIAAHAQRMQAANDAAFAFHGIAPQPVGSIIELPSAAFAEWA